jgi:hypothetical protein
MALLTRFRADMQHALAVELREERAGVDATA